MDKKKDELIFLNGWNLIFYERGRNARSFSSMKISNRQRVNSSHLQTSEGTTIKIGCARLTPAIGRKDVKACFTGLDFRNWIEIEFYSTGKIYWQMKDFGLKSKKGKK